MWLLSRFFGPPDVDKLRAQNDVDGLIRALRFRDADVREAAAGALGEIRDARAVGPLVAALRDENIDVRGSAAYALGQIGLPAMEPLLSVLRDENAVLRQSAANALGWIQDERVVDPLLAALQDGDAEVRRLAVWGLLRTGDQAAQAVGEIGGSQVSEPLLDALEALDSSVSLRAAVALGKRREVRAVEPLVAVLRNPYRSGIHGAAARALGEIGQPAVELLLTILREAPPDVKTHAAMALGATKDCRAAGPLMDAIQYAWSPKTAIAAAQALGDIGQPAVDLLLATLRDGAADRRPCAAWALGEIRDSQAVGPLAAVLVDGSQDIEVRLRAAPALGKIGGATVIDVLTESLKDPVPDVAIAAREALDLVENRL